MTLKCLKDVFGHVAILRSSMNVYWTRESPGKYHKGAASSANLTLLLQQENQS